jgi:hypothetical protein
MARRRREQKRNANLDEQKGRLGFAEFAKIFLFLRSLNRPTVMDTAKKSAQAVQCFGRKVCSWALVVLCLYGGG